MALPSWLPSSSEVFLRHDERGRGTGVTSEAHAGHLYTPSGRSRISGCPHSQACRPTARGSAVICRSVSRSTPLRIAPQDGQRAEPWPEGSSSCTSQKGQRRERAPAVIRSRILLTLFFRGYFLGEVCRVDGGEHIGQVANFLYARLAYSRISGRGPAPKISAVAAVRTPRGFRSGAVAEVLRVRSSSPTHPRGWRQPSGELPPRPVRGRLWRKGSRGTIVDMDQAIAQGEI